ncbi:hypothetical protein GGTG_14301 [Gaeumannomyces tritici R3-111a-1]|uniref:Uncharacterized protein n=1 Tax=Gaeumannomyces tritici (strain R3-111a-1) TaxID=644352 RepID=J3PL55_GAET3|nr:hypothetical protein GGTG_14301 [Gaeumannomyces tritici R3-111a-1]EJT68119.1 hypothetical protein GGTG_14301 [Gaeumannomyces tritici R3-111a-1]
MLPVADMMPRTRANEGGQRKCGTYGRRGNARLRSAPFQNPSASLDRMQAMIGLVLLSHWVEPSMHHMFSGDDE